MTGAANEAGAGAAATTERKTPASAAAAGPAEEALGTDAAITLNKVKAMVAAATEAGEYVPHSHTYTHTRQRLLARSSPSYCTVASGP